MFVFMFMHVNIPLNVDVNVEFEVDINVNISVANDNHLLGKLPACFPISKPWSSQLYKTFSSYQN